MLIEDSSLDEIVAYFERAGIKIKVHKERPPDPPAGGSRHGAEWWVDLHAGDAGGGWPHFGSGEDQEGAIRSAAARWRIEQVGLNNQRQPGDPLP